MAFAPTSDWLVAQPLASSTALPAPYYVDPAAHELDRAAVLARSWQLVAHEGAFAAAGDHVFDEIGGVPILVVRGDDGVLRALHNVCRHRAGPIAVTCGAGQRALRCRYHGWTYGLDGVLRCAPEMADARDFEPRAVRLPEARVATWSGLVFVAIGEVPTLDAVLAGVSARTAALGLPDFRHVRRVSYELACNWKAYVDNYLEGYHLPHVHPVLNRMLDYRAYATELGDWHSLQSSPLEAAQGPYADGEALYYFVYPNTMLNLLPGRLQTNRVVPLAPQRCRVDFDYYYPGGARADALGERDVEFSDEVQREDVAICEAVQRGLASGSYFAGRLNPKRESGVHHFHELLRRAYREQPVAS
ncbi:MAG TPA: aromatic ring-hydroxylating dioxygenase subunit alpha [Candidatus Saccharimonadia bacterium]|nr:aromatic ring-hydroxylating dioxygenase subunit alpha [Candidatus Saccharimonadia bacterium]